MRAFIGLLSLLISFQAFGAQEKFGPEWTFTNDDLISLSRRNASSRILEASVRDKWIEKIRRKCSECSINGYHVTVNPEFWFTLDTDPFVFEVKAEPLTVRQFKALENKIQEVLFDTAAEAGLYVHNRLVGGHIHLDKESNFDGNELLMRNFIVDLFNNPEIFMGVWSHDYMNAPPFAVLGTEAGDKFVEVLRKHDAKELTYAEFVAGIREIYDEHGTIHNSDKYQAVNLSHGETFEIRGFQPQQSAKQHLAMITLMEKRIDYLRRFKKPIPFLRKNYHEKIKWTEDRELHTYTTLLDPKIIVRTYREFVEETGLDWNDYKIYAADKRLKRYMASSRASRAVCKGKLKKRTR